jgi:hypothetical protein
VKSAMAAAAGRQKATDAAVLRCLNNITLLARDGFLPAAEQAQAAAASATEAAAVPGTGSTESRKRRRLSVDQARAEFLPGSAGCGAASAGPARSTAGSVQALGVAGVAAFLGGPLAWLLRLLFQNDSLLDIGGRQDLYRAGMRLIR